jgi:chromosome segregation ATPase
MERMRESAKMGVMEANVESMREEAQRSIEQLGQQRAISEKLKSSLGLLQAELATEQCKAQEAVAAKDDLENRIQSFRDELQALQTENKSRKHELQIVTERERKCLKHVEELTGEVKNLSEAVQRAEEAGMCASRELDACQKTLTSNNYELEQLKENLRDAQMEAADARVCSGS